MKKLIREVKVSDLILYLSAPPLTAALLWVLYGLFVTPDTPAFPFILITAILVTLFLFKQLLIGLVLLYKATAPLSLRAQCLFEPTCSTYMIMALKKYGLFVGLYKGIHRLLRCKIPNGGVDYP